MPVVAYSFGLVTGVLALVSLLCGGWWTLSTPVFIFGIVPLLELLLAPGGGNLDAQRETVRRAALLPQVFLLGTLPLQVSIVLTMLWQVSSGALTGWECLGAVATVAITCGAYGINAAHELGHRTSKAERLAAKTLLFTTHYMHFFIEHNRGHHARVATEDDPASAHTGQTVYAFWVQSLWGSYRSAWELEDKRLRKHARPRWTWDNQMVRFTTIQVAGLAAAVALFGPSAGACWLAASLGGALLLETVNYIEHYGLSRQKKANGRYERVQPHHSWNSNHPLGRLLLFELTRHSDHHAHPARPYVALRHFQDVPQLPTGYTGMMVLALAPPLFFRVMHRQLHREQARLALAA